MINGYGLKAKHIIHAVGPIYSCDADADKLKGAYHNSLVLADNNGLKSIVFCSISTGIYGYPLDKATDIAIRTMLNFEAKSLEHCYVYCFQDIEYYEFEKALNKYES